MIPVAIVKIGSYARDFSENFRRAVAPAVRPPRRPRDRRPAENIGALFLVQQRGMVGCPRRLAADLGGAGGERRVVGLDRQANRIFASVYSWPQ